MLPSLSPAETEVLRLVWQLESATVQQSCEALPEDRCIAYATVQTLLRRLEKKGYVRHKSKGKAHVFYGAVKRDKVVKQRCRICRAAIRRRSLATDVTSRRS